MDLLDGATGAWRLYRSVAHYAVGWQRMTTPVQSITLLITTPELQKKPAGPVAPPA
jgi:hypothetical protein